MENSSFSQIFIRFFLNKHCLYFSVPSRSRNFRRRFFFFEKFFFFLLVPLLSSSSILFLVLSFLLTESLSTTFRYFSYKLARSPFFYGRCFFAESLKMTEEFVFSTCAFYKLFSLSAAMMSQKRILQICESFAAMVSMLRTHALNFA